MSTTSTPVHYVSETQPYDPFFTADISNRMRVPDHIQVSGKNRSNQLHMEANNTRIDMNVPDRIIVAGSNQHISAPAQPRELQLESSVMKSAPDPVGLRTPPRTLTLEEHGFPSIDDTSRTKEQAQKNEIPNGGIVSNNRLQIIDRDEFFAPEISDAQLINQNNMVRDMSNLRHSDVDYFHNQINRFERRLQILEYENLQLQQRSMAVCTIGVVYLFFKGLFWLRNL